MKGFAVTPLLFVGILLVAGLMFLHFSQYGQALSEAAAREGRLAGLESDFLAYRTSLENSLLFRSALEASEGTVPEGITDCGPDSITVSVPYTFQKQDLDCWINRTGVIEKTITCELIRQVTWKGASLGCGLNCTL